EGVRAGAVLAKYGGTVRAPRPRGGAGWGRDAGFRASLTRSGGLGGVQRYPRQPTADPPATPPARRDPPSHQKPTGVSRPRRPPMSRGCTTVLAVVPFPLPALAHAQPAE